MIFLCAPLCSAVVKKCFLDDPLFTSPLSSQEAGFSDDSTDEILDESRLVSYG